MYCPQCGKETSSKYCPDCGQAMPAANKEDIVPTTTPALPDADEIVVAQQQIQHTNSTPATSSVSTTQSTQDNAATAQVSNAAHSSQQSVAATQTQVSTGNATVPQIIINNTIATSNENTSAATSESTSAAVSGGFVRTHKILITVILGIIVLLLAAILLALFILPDKNNAVASPAPVSVTVPASAPQTAVEATEDKPFVPIDSRYIVPVYEDFNSPAEENGLEDTLIAFEGTVTSLETYQDAIYFLVDTADGEWLVAVGDRTRINYYDVAAADLVGKKVHVYAIYGGFSGVVKLPSCIVAMDTDMIIDTETNNVYNFLWEGAKKQVLG